MRNTVAKQLRKFSFGDSRILAQLKRQWNAMPRPIRHEYMEYLQEDYEYIKYQQEQQKKPKKQRPKISQEEREVLEYLSPKKSFWQRWKANLKAWFVYFFPFISKSKK